MNIGYHFLAHSWGVGRSMVGYIDEIGFYRRSHIATTHKYQVWIRNACWRQAVNTIQSKLFTKVSNAASSRSSQQSLYCVELLGK